MMAWSRWRGWRLAALLAVAIGLAVAASPGLADQPPPSPGGATPDEALAATLSWARAEAAKGCDNQQADRLVRVLCAGVLRVGVRGSYPLFATGEGARRSGYEIDIARALAGRLGVAAEFVPVTPANRIALLAEDRIDLTIATMGHTTLRDGQALFIRPHYYSSRTVLVGSRELHVPDFAALAGRTVCVTVGNASNAEMSAHGARLLLFDSPEQLLDRLRAEACSLIAQDNSFFAGSFADPVFAAVYDEKFSFAPVPWGMAVAREGSARLGQALAMISAIFHRDGVFLALARQNHIATGFLEEQHRLWSGRCDTAASVTGPGCVIAPLATDLAPTSFAPQVSAVETWLAAHAGIHPTLTMFKIVPAWDLVREGTLNSLVLIASTLAATLAFSLLFGLVLGARTTVLRWPARLITVLLQSSPIVLTLVIAAAIANAVFTFSAAVALSASILALGLTNGCYAGQAISEAMATLRAEAAGGPAGDAPVPDRQLFARALHHSITQITDFLINATKGTPIASFIGTPELLNALTDSTSYSAERATTYWLLLIFYTLAVLAVMRLCTGLGTALERRTTVS